MQGATDRPWKQRNRHVEFSTAPSFPKLLEVAAYRAE